MPPTQPGGGAILRQDGVVIRQGPSVSLPPVIAACGLLLACSLFLGCGAASAGRPLAVPPVAKLPAARSSHLVEIVMENREYGDVIGSPSAPYVNRLARRYGLATASHAITHPSLPNYIALTSGTTGGIESDCTSCSVDARNLPDQLEGPQALQCACVQPARSTAAKLTTDQRLYVYRRQSCLRCGAPVEWFDLANRRAYACPVEQAR